MGYTKERKLNKAPGLLIVASMLLFFYGVILGGLQVVIADIAEFYSVNIAGMGLLISIQNITAMLAPAGMGRIADRVGKQKILVLFSLVFGIGCAFAGLSKHLRIYILGAALIGAGYSVCESVSSAALSDLNPERGAQYINFTQFALALGAMTGPVVHAICMRKFGTDWRLVLLVCAFAFICMAPLLAKTSFIKPDCSENEKAEITGGYQEYFRNGVFVSLIVLIMLYVGLECGFGYFIDSLLDSSTNIMDAGSFAVSAYWLGMAASRFIFGLYSYNPVRILRVCYALSFLLILAMLKADSLLVLILMSMLIGAAYGPVWTTLMSGAAALYPKRSATATGIMSTACAISGIASPAAMGMVSQWFGTKAAFIMLAAMAATGYVIMLVLKQNKE